MPNHEVEKLVLQTLAELMETRASVHATDVVDRLSPKVSPNAVKEAIWRLADRHKIEFKQGRALAPAA